MKTKEQTMKTKEQTMKTKEQTMSNSNEQTMSNSLFFSGVWGMQYICGRDYDENSTDYNMDEHSEFELIYNSEDYNYQLKPIGFGVGCAWEDIRFQLHTGKPLNAGEFRGRSGSPSCGYTEVEYRRLIRKEQTAYMDALKPLKHRNHETDKDEYHAVWLFARPNNGDSGRIVMVLIDLYDDMNLVQDDGEYVPGARDRIISDDALWRIGRLQHGGVAHGEHK